LFCGWLLFDRLPFIKLQEKELVLNNPLLAIVDGVDDVDKKNERKDTPKPPYYENGPV
jgi:hypothetical protein